MTDRGQLDLISLLVNLFLSPLLVHRSYTFYPFMPSLPFSPCLLYLAPSPSQHLSPLFLLCSHPPTSFFLYFTSLLLLPSLSIALSMSQSLFHLFGCTLSCSGSARHPGPFIISLLVFSLSFDNFLSSFSSIIMRFFPNLFDLAVTLSLHFICLSTCVSVSLQGWPVAKCCVCVRSRCSLVIASKCFGNTRDLLSCQCN